MMYHHIKYPLVIFSAVVALSSIRLVKASSSGAPYEACNNGLTPKHSPNKASPYSVPFIITANSSSYSANQGIEVIAGENLGTSVGHMMQPVAVQKKYNSLGVNESLMGVRGPMLSVVIEGVNGESFKGFAVQALEVKNGKNHPAQHGTWSGQDIKKLPCATVTHTDSHRKSRVVLLWTPEEGSGKVIFRGTVVEKYDTYYTNIKSTTVSSSSGLVSGSDSSNPSNEFFNWQQQKRRPVHTQEHFGFHSRPGSTHKDDDGSIEGSFGQDPFNSFFHQQQSSGFSQPDRNRDDQASESVHFFQNPHPSQYPYFQGFNRQREHHKSHDTSDSFADFPSPSAHSQRFAPRPQYYDRQPPHQSFEGPWREPHF